MSLSKHYSRLINNIGIPFKLLTFLALAFILYGYLARELNIYLFWESKSIGYGLLLIAIAKFLINDINARGKKKMHRIIFYLVLGIICLLIFAKILMALIIPNSEAFNSMTKILKNDNELKAEVGKKISFSYLPSGSLESQTNEFGTTGNANLNIIIKGNNKYLEKNVILKKESKEEWKIISIE